MTAQAGQSAFPRGEVGYNGYESRVSSYQARNPAERAPSPVSGDSQARDSQAPWQAPGIDIGVRPIPVPAPAQEPAKKVAFDPNAKEQDGQAKPAATPAPERGFVTVTTTTYPVFMHHPVAPQTVHVLPPPVAPMPAPRLVAPVEKREQPTARGNFEYDRVVHHHDQVRANQAASPVFVAPAQGGLNQGGLNQGGFNYERILNHHDQVRVNQAASPVFVAPAPVAAPRPQVVVAQAPVQMPVQTPAPAQGGFIYERNLNHHDQLRVNQAASPVFVAPAPVAAPRPQVVVAQATPAPAQGGFNYERIVNHHEHVRVSGAQGPVIIAPAPAAVPRAHATTQATVQTTEKRHRYSVMHDWSPVVAFAVTVIFTGFMVSLAVPFAAASILFPTAVMIAATSLFIKAAMHRRS